MIRPLFLAASVLSLACGALLAEALPSDSLTVDTPATEGKIFGSSMPPGTPDALFMAEHDYTEREYFVSGKANLYRHDAEGTLEVANADIPYTTRILVIHPRDPEQFSGRAIIEPYHPGAAATSWVGMRDFTVRNGDIYVGVFVGGASARHTAQAREMAGAEPRGDAGAAMSGRELPAGAARMMDGLATLLTSDPARYADINWPDNNGVAWDVFGSVAQLLRSDSANNPLQDFPVKRMYGTGWSATGSFLRTYTNEGFHDIYRRADGSPAIDGYVIGISQGSFVAGYNPIAEGEPLPAPTDPRRRPRGIDVPFVEIMSESEAVSKVGPPVEDSDGEAGFHRYYELPGTTHTDAMGGAASPNFTVDCPLPSTDVPFLAVIYAAFENIHRWVETGETPPRQQAAMEVIPGPEGSDYKVVAAKDALGNARGGIRVAEIEVPLARYGISGDPRCASPLPGALIEMRRNPLPRSVLDELYPGGRSEYLERYETRLDELIADRWILVEEKESLMNKAREAAAAAFD